MKSIKWANKYKILSSHFRLKKIRLSYERSKNVAIYAFSSGKILDVRKVAGVKDMTNIMSDPQNPGHYDTSRSLVAPSVPTI